MYPWIQRRPALTVGPPSSLLTLVAGEFAPHVAGWWPQPHGDFLTAPADRRHLVFLAITRAGETPRMVEPDRLLRAALRDVLDELFVGDPPQGLARALSRMGDSAWAAADYRLLVEQLRVPAAAKALHHAQALQPELVRAFAALPAPLVEARIGAAVPLTGEQARLLAEAYGVLVRRDPDEAAAAVRRWAGARNAKRLFEQVGDALLPELPPPPFPGTDRLRPLATKAAIRDAAVRYRNCLRGQIGPVVDGDAAFYEWAGPPGMVVQIFRDRHYGWRLSEAKLARNASPPQPLRDALEAELRSWGVSVGRSQWDIENAVERAHEPGFYFGQPATDWGVYE